MKASASAQLPALVHPSLHADVRARELRDRGRVEPGAAEADHRLEIGSAADGRGDGPQRAERRGTPVAPEIVPIDA